jgi:SET domain-containing protein
MLHYEIRNTKTGKGLFTLKQFEKDEVILKFQGKTLKREDIKDVVDSDNLLQIGPDLFLDISGFYGFFINHACQPNCYLKIMTNQAFLVAMKTIKKNDELFFDYSSTSTDTKDTWLLKCKCHEFYCRDEVSGFRYLPDALKKKYIDNGYVPKYVINS